MSAPLPDEEPGFDPEDFVPDEREQREAEADDTAHRFDNPEQDKT